MSFYDKLKFDANGLIPAIVQDARSQRVLMPKGILPTCALVRELGLSETDSR